MSINYLAVLVATLVFYFIGALYYTVLSKPWIASRGTTIEKLGKEKPNWGHKAAPFLISFVLSFIVFDVFASLLNMMSTKVDWVFGAYIGFKLWLGFCLPVTIINNAYQNATKRLSLIDTTYFLMGMVVGGAILGLMR